MRRTPETAPGDVSHMPWGRGVNPSATDGVRALCPGDALRWQGRPLRGGHIDRQIWLPIVPPRGSQAKRAATSSRWPTTSSSMDLEVAVIQVCLHRHSAPPLHLTSYAFVKPRDVQFQIIRLFGLKITTETRSTQGFRSPSALR